LAEISPVQVQHAEHYLVNVVKSGNNTRNFTDLRRELFHFSKSTLHQNLPPTSQGLEPLTHHAFCNAYVMMHILDGLNGAPMTEINPEEFGFTLEDGPLLPSSA